VLFTEVIAVYFEKHIKLINTKCSVTDCYFPLVFKGLIVFEKQVTRNIFGVKKEEVLVTAGYC
jgi:hypothetical protein